MNKKFELTGSNIYRDKHGAAIYYDKKKKLGYRISAEKEKAFNSARSRLSYAVIVFVLMSIVVKLDLWISIPASIATLIALEYRFRKFLKTLTMVQNFDPSQNVSTVQTVEGIQKTIIKIVLYIVLAVLLVVNTKTNTNVADNQPVVYASYVVAVFAVYMAIKNIVAVVKRSK